MAVLVSIKRTTQITRIIRKQEKSRWLLGSQLRSAVQQQGSVVEWFFAVSLCRWGHGRSGSLGGVCGSVHHHRHRHNVITVDIDRVVFTAVFYYARRIATQVSSLAAIDHGLDMIDASIVQ
jgi:hypothetical protein